VDEAALREKVGQLLSEVQRKPETGTHDRADRGPRTGAASAMRREMASLEDSLDHIRLAVKYLVFDLEATKRENRLLRGLLGEV
jgi:hypothetical protein